MPNTQKRQDARHFIFCIFIFFYFCGHPKGEGGREQVRQTFPLCNYFKSETKLVAHLVDTSPHISAFLHTPRYIYIYIFIFVNGSLPPCLLSISNAVSLSLGRCMIYDFWPKKKEYLWPKASPWSFLPSFLPIRTTNTNRNLNANQNQNQNRNQNRKSPRVSGRSRSQSQSQSQKRSKLSTQIILIENYT